MVNKPEFYTLVSNGTSEQLKEFLGGNKTNTNWPQTFGRTSAVDTLINLYLLDKTRPYVKAKIEILVAHESTSLEIPSPYSNVNPFECACMLKDEWLISLMLASKKQLSFHGVVLKSDSGARRHWLLIFTHFNLAHEAELNAICELKPSLVNTTWNNDQFFKVAMGLGLEEKREFCFSAKYKNDPTVNITKLVNDAKEYLCLGNKLERK